jgi:hypothetical protein
MYNSGNYTPRAKAAEERGKRASESTGDEVAMSTHVKRARGCPPACVLYAQSWSQNRRSAFTPTETKHKKSQRKLGMVTHTCKPRSWYIIPILGQAKAGESHISSKHELHH